MSSLLTPIQGVTAGPWNVAQPVAPASAPAGSLVGVSFVNGWGNIALPDATYSPLRYRYDRATKMVRIVGAISGGAFGTPAIILPARFRPADDVLMIVSSTDGLFALACQVTASTGAVIPLAGISSAPPGGSGITDLTSTGGTITVTNPTGPTSNVDLPTTGVAAGTYGDATHVGQFTVDAEGRLTAASSDAISGLSGSGLVKIYDNTLGSNQLSIDTGANGIPGGHIGLIIYIYVRTDRVAANDDVGFRFNNDSSASYDDQQFSGANTGTAIGFQAAATSFFAQCVSSTGFANAFTAIRIDVYNYDNTTGYKSAIVHSADAQSTGAASIFDTHAAEWRSTSAINQFAVFSQTGSHLITGSRMTVFGIQ